MSLSLEDPRALFLLAAIPIAWLFARSSRAGLPGARSILAASLRSVVLLLLVGAIAGLQEVRPQNDLTVFFLLDASSSVPPTVRQECLRRINTVCREQMTDEDRAGLIVFGADASIESSPARHLDLPALASVIESSATDLSAAIRLALAAFPEGGRRRIVLLSDGNENRGSALLEARSAAAAGVPIDVVPLTPPPTAQEVFVDALRVPERVDENDSFDVQVVVQARRDGPVKIHLFENGALVANEERPCFAGKNVFLVPRKLAAPGARTYEAVIEADGDTIPQNNRGLAFTSVTGRPRVLIVESDPRSTCFGPALQRELSSVAGEEVIVEVCGPDQIPSDLYALQSYDAIVLSNIHATWLSYAQMQMLESAVHDLGIGLVMIGGEDSFGAGGYLNTPVERALPVSMDITQNRVLPNGCLVFVVDHISCIGDWWSREICIGALKGLNSQDLSGLIYQSGGPPRWLYPISKVSDAKGMIDLIQAAPFGEMSSLEPPLVMARKALQECPAGLKHILVVTDGYANVPSNGTVDALVNEKVTISVALIEQFDQGAIARMQALAARGKGQFFLVQPNEHHKLPQIIIREAALVKKGLFFEERFAPVMKEATETVRGFGAADFPALRGYNATSIKPLADEPLVSNHSDPILAHWRYGLGKAVAFTSDAKSRWAAEWVGWDRFDKFWAQSIRWVLRPSRGSEYRVQARIEGGEGRLTLDAVDAEGHFVNDLVPRGMVLGPELAARPAEFVQTAPGRYEATFDAEKVGPYVYTLGYTRANGEAGGLSGGMAVPYAPDFRDIVANPALLERLAEVTKGRRLRERDLVFLRDGEPGLARQAVWPGLLMWAILLFPLDIFVRRVMIGPHEVRQAWAHVAKSIPWLPARLRPSLTPEGRTLRPARATPLSGAPVDRRFDAPEGADSAIDPSLLRKHPRDANADFGTATPQAPDAPLADDTSYTARLLQAKERARKSRSDDR